MKLTDEQILKYQKRARLVARRKGYPELADDFAQELIVLWLRGSGSHQTIDQSFIDYLRSQYGRARACGSGSGRLSEYRNYVNLDEIRNLADDSRPVERERCFAYLFTGREAELYQACFIDERAEHEIAQEWGVSPSRISQMLNPMKREIQDAAILEEGMDRIQWDESFGKVLVDWIKL